MEGVGKDKIFVRFGVELKVIFLLVGGEGEEVWLGLGKDYDRIVRIGGARWEWEGSFEDWLIIRWFL